MQKDVSRRGFLKSGAAATLGIAGAAGILAGSAYTKPALADEAENSVPPEWDATLPEAWDRETEMLVLGCGIAGACAAVEGYDLGLDLIVVDAAEEITDCCCTLSGGALTGCGTSIQADQGIEDDVEVMIKDVRRCGGDMGDPEVIRTFCELSGETVDWLWDLGCDVVENVSLSEPSHTIARTHRTNPPGNGLGWMEGLQYAIEDRGIEMMQSTRATKLYRDADGVVVGAHVEPKNGDPAMDIRATKGVVLAVGGLGGNLDLWPKYCPTMEVIASDAKRVLSAGPSDVNGDGYEMLEAINAYLYPVPPNYACGGNAISPDGPCSGILLPYSWTSSVIEVNENGERFNNEASFHEFYDLKINLDQPHKWHVCLFDETARLSSDGVNCAQPIIDVATENNMESVKKADTIEELAEMFGLPADAVKAAVDDFNAHLESGEEDAFGRTEWEGEKIETPPFWGIETNVNVGTSKGGCKMNTKAQALDRHHEVIPHLYVAGEVAFFPVMGNASIHIVGGSNGTAANYGRIAARSIAEETALESAMA